MTAKPMNKADREKWYAEVVNETNKELARQEEKVAMLKEAGVWDVIGFPGCIDKLIDMVAAHEREACAKVCEQLGALNTATPQKIAASIRARG